MGHLRLNQKRSIGISMTPADTKLRRNKEPKWDRLSENNRETLELLIHALGIGVRTYRELCELARYHLSGDARKPYPSQFVDYCMNDRNQWIAKL